MVAYIFQNNIIIMIINIIILEYSTFLCFFFSDTEAERNALKEHVYPKLRDFCRENYGIEFQVSTKILMILICFTLNVLSICLPFL